MSVYTYISRCNLSRTLSKKRNNVLESYSIRLFPHGCSSFIKFQFIAQTPTNTITLNLKGMKKIEYLEILDSYLYQTINSWHVMKLGDLTAILQKIGLNVIKTHIFFGSFKTINTNFNLYAQRIWFCFKESPPFWNLQKSYIINEIFNKFEFMKFRAFVQER